MRFARYTYRAGRRPPTRDRVLRILLLGVLMALLAMATGCQSVLKDILLGDTCGDHEVCGRHAAAAGAAAGIAGAAGTYLQRKEDDPTGPWPWEKDSAEFDRELDELTEDRSGAGGVKSAGQPAGSGVNDVTEGPEESIEDILKDEEPPEGDSGATGPADEQKPGKDEGSQPEGEEDYEEEPDRSKTDEGEQPEDKDASKDKEGGKQKDTGKDKVTSPAATYVPLTTVGDVTILMDPKTHKISVSNGTYIGGKDQNGYWITDGGNVVMYNNETGKATVSDGQFTATRDGTTYTVTDDNKVLKYDQNGNLTVSDGHFTATREGMTYAVTSDNKIIEYHQESGGFKVTDGHFTATHEGTVYSVTRDNRILEYDKASGNIKISDGHFTASHEGTVYSVTRDNKILEFNQASGDINVSDGHFTATRDGTVYSVTRDNKILEFNQGSGDFKVTDGHYVLEHEGSTTAFTKDNVAVEYDRDLHMVAVNTKGQRSDVTLALGRGGQYGVDATVKGSMDGTPTTFGVTAARYNLPETGGQGFAGGLRLEQKDFEFRAAYVREMQERQLNIDIRKDDWSAGFMRSEDTKQYYVGYRDVKVTHEEGMGRTLTMGGVTRRFGRR